MINFILIYFIISHFIADFYLQSEDLAILKRTKAIKLFKHSLIYQILMIIPFFIFEFNLWFLLIGLISGITHYLIDFIKNILLKKTNVSKVWAFIFDQALHLLIISILVYYFGDKSTDVSFTFAYRLSERYIDYLRWILLIIMILKPANISFKVIFGNLKPENKEISVQESSERTPIRNAGANIGNFERLLYVICLATGQYTAMGFIITGKGFARHSYIQKHPAFAEYFLIGTFYSILFSVISYGIIFYLL